MHFCIFNDHIVNWKDFNIFLGVRALRSAVRESAQLLLCRRLSAKLPLLSIANAIQKNNIIMTHRFLLSIAFLVWGISISAQYQIGLIPRSSPDKSCFQKVGFTEVEIKYGSPKVKGRKVWGELVPYKKVWRAGANKATTINFTTDVNIQGKVLKSGLYSFFVEINDNNIWTGIFNNVANQWGSFNYDVEQDALRIPLNVTHNQPHVESLSYKIQDHGFDNGSVLLKWEKLVLSFSFEVDYLENFISIINNKAEDSDINIKWVVYLQGAEHLIDKEAKSQLALDWLEKREQLQDSIIAWNNQFYPIEYIEAHRIWTKARYYKARGELEIAQQLRDKLLDNSYDLFYKKNKEEIDNFISP